VNGDVPLGVPSIALTIAQHALKLNLKEKMGPDANQKPLAANGHHFLSAKMT